MDSKVKELLEAAKAIQYNFSEHNRDRLGKAIDAIENECIENCYAKGKEIKRFWHEHWPSGYIHFDNGFKLEYDNGEFALKDDETYDLRKLGIICPYGHCNSNGAFAKCEDFMDVFNRYRQLDNFQKRLLR